MNNEILRDLLEDYEKEIPTTELQYELDFCWLPNVEILKGVGDSTESFIVKGEGIMLNGQVDSTEEDIFYLDSIGHFNKESYLVELDKLNKRLENIKYLISIPSCEYEVEDEISLIELFKKIDFLLVPNLYKGQLESKEPYALIFNQNGELRVITGTIWSDNKKMNVFEIKDVSKFEHTLYLKHLEELKQIVMSL